MSGFSISSTAVPIWSRSGDLSIDGDLDFTGPQAITTSSGALTLTPTTDTMLSNGTGMVIGHTAQLTVDSVLPEFQMMGNTHKVDSGMVLGHFSADANGPMVYMAKSRHGDVGGNTIVVNNDVIGAINFVPNDGATPGFNTVSASFKAVVDDASPEAGGVGMSFVWQQQAGGGTSGQRTTMTIDARGILYVGADDAIGASYMAEPGLVINQNDSELEILALKSSDVTHAVTTAGNGTEADTFGLMKKRENLGGLLLAGYIGSTGDLDIATTIRGVTTDEPSTTHGTGGYGVVQVTCAKDNGSNNIGSIGSNGNLLSVDNSGSTKFIVDAEGDIFYDGASATYADEHDDALMVRALDHARASMGGQGLIRDKWDSFIKYNEQDLIDANILGGSINEGGHINLTGLQRLHNGAIWQGYVRQQEMKERIGVLEDRLLAIEGV